MNLSTLQLPPPEDWQDFERLCADLWRRLWKSPNVMRFGGPGERQGGLDLLFVDPEGRWAGVQCKLRSQLRGRTLTGAQVRVEVAAARQFNEAIQELVIATTAPRRKQPQLAAAKASHESGLQVTVFAWEDILEVLSDHPDLVAKHFPGLFDSAAARAAEASRGLDQVRQEYLGCLWDELLPVPLLALRRRSGQNTVALSEVYTALDVTIRLEAGAERRSRGKDGPESEIFAGLRADPAYLSRLRRRLAAKANRSLTALEAAAACPRLVLLGAPGGGKSTFARHLALCLIGQTLGDEAVGLARLNGLAPGSRLPPAEELPWPHGSLLPIFVELRRFVGGPAFPKEGETGKAEHLLRYLELWGEENHLPGAAALLQGSLREPAATLLILDGLDETPSAEETRDRLRQVVESTARRFGGCRILVTSRPYAYEAGSPWRLDGAGFGEASLAPFDTAKTRAFVEGWYRHLVLCGQVKAEHAPGQSKLLLEQVTTMAYLRPLAERPLLLTMMTELHASRGGRLDGGRAAIYQESADLLLDRWNEVRGLRDAATLGEGLGLEVADLRHALEALAFRVHQEASTVGASTAGASEDGDREEAGDIPVRYLWEALKEHRPAKGTMDERKVREYLHQRSGILLEVRPEVYRFPHRSYQEYLAACHLTNDLAFPGPLLELLAADPGRWREITLLAAGEVRERLSMVWALLDGLVPALPGEAPAQDPGFRLALYAGLAAVEIDLPRHPRAPATKLDCIRRWLERCLVVGALEPRERAEAGRALAALGDGRFGVGVKAGVPEIDWVDVPAGEFLMGSGAEDEDSLSEEKPQHRVTLPSYRIAKYPITNLQYQAFVDDDGYGERWRSCWTAAGWDWKGKRTRPNDDLPDSFLLANHPRVNVSWYEAWAFSRWLGARLGMEVRLPTEAEWEKAARGPDGWVYPWGNEFAASRCNSGDLGLGQTTAVGCFPSGVSPYGALDMSGNVWEWCLSQWRSDYQKPAQDDPEGAASRVWRGGSYIVYLRGVRCAARVVDVPQDAYDDPGFRPVAPSRALKN